MRSLLTAFAAMIFLAVVADPGNAQRKSQRNVAGDFDYYSLVLSWSPTYCDAEGDKRRDPQCRPRKERPYAFVLHGLWPQYERGYPNNCRTRERPFVSEPIINAMLDIMPSRGLIIHEYKKHGTCSGLTPRQYYGASRKLFEFIKIPPRFIAPQKEQFIGVRELKKEFAKVNRALKPDMIGVVCRRGGGNRLREIRICFTRKGRLRSCGANENQRKLCRADRMFVPPVRYTR